MIPAMLSRVNFQNGIRATPAGSEMNVRITGSMREKKTVAAAVALEPAVRPGEVLRRDVQPLAVLLEQLDAAVVADPVGDPGADQVAQHARPATISSIVKRPSATSKPANSMIASLEVGMQALSSSIRRKIPARPRSPITFVAKSTIGSVSEAM